MHRASEGGSAVEEEEQVVADREGRQTDGARHAGDRW